MARSRKKRAEGYRADGIVGKHGKLYVIVHRTIHDENGKKYKTDWIPTGLDDTQKNVIAAIEMQKKLLYKMSLENLDLDSPIDLYVERFLKAKERVVADTTYAKYEQYSNRIKDYFDGYTLRQIRTELVEEFLDDLFRSRNMQRETVKCIKNVFAAILEEAVQDGLIGENYARKAIINKQLASKHSKVVVEDDNFFSYKEALRFLKIVEDHSLYELFYVSLFFGLRREEVLGLKWSAIDFNKKTLKIMHTVTKGKQINRLDITKSASSARMYPLTDTQIEMFQNLRKKEKEYKKLFRKAEYTENDYIFKHEDGKLYHPDHPSKAFTKVIKRNPDLPQHVTFHGLRSSCVSILIHKGFDVKSIQKWVGHADVDTTLRIYAKVKDKESKQELSTAMESLFQPKIRKEE